MNRRLTLGGTTLRSFVLVAVFLAMPRIAAAQRACATPAGGQLTCTYNGVTFTMTDLEKFAPEVQFHFAERFFPASIDWMLARSGLFDASNNLVKVQPGQQDLAAAPSDDHLVLDPNDPTVAFGMPPRNNWSMAPMYVAVQVPASRDWVDIHYVMLFPYNGPQTYRALRCGTEFNFFGETMAEHQGDLEMISVRVTADFKTVLSVRYESHGDSRYFKPAQVTFQTDAAGNHTHPLVASALHSHSTWNPTAYNSQDWEYSFELDCSGGTIDLIGSGTASKVRWRPWDPNTGASLTLIGLDAAGQPVNDQVWAKFSGRLGPEQENDITDSVYGIGLNPDGTPESLPAFDKAYAVLMLRAGELILNLKDWLGLEDKTGKFHANGPGGPGGRDWIGPPSPTTVYLRSRVYDASNNLFDLYLTANSSGSATVEPLQACRADQVWETSLWAASDDGKAGSYGFTLVNRMTGKMLESPGNRSVVTMTAPLSLANLAPNRVWSIGAREVWADPNEPLKNVPYGYGFAAFRPFSDFHANLNVFGDDYVNVSGATVGLWDWGRCSYPGPPGWPSFIPFTLGCPNIIWRFEPASCAAPPTSSATINGTLGTNGWYVSNPTGVTISGSPTARAIQHAVDNAASINTPGQTVSINLSADGSHALTFGALDNAGGLENPMHHLTVNIDSTAPSIVASRAPLANTFGWNNVPVTVGFACSDATSGVETCTSPQTVSVEGNAQTVTGNARDFAGNTAATVVTGISIDMTPPTVTTVVTPTPNAAGWNNTPVTVSLIAKDALSGIASASGPVIVKDNVAHYKVTLAAADKAGNRSSTTTIVNVDRTPPELSVQFDAGTQDIAVLARDTLSGVAIGSLLPTSAVSICTRGSVPPPPGVIDDNPEWVQYCHSGTRGQRRTYSTIDNAGNTLDVVVDVLVDRNEVHARIVSVSYNGASPRNVQHNVTSYRMFPGAAVSLRQQVTRGSGPSAERVETAFEAQRNVTQIVAFKSGRTTRQSRPGLVLLKLSTSTGSLGVAY